MRVHRSMTLVIVLLPFMANAAAAQATRSIQCAIDNFADGWVAQCSSDEECSRLYATHLCERHGICPNSGGDYVTPTPNPAKAPLLGALTGAVVGGALGGAAEMGKSDEQKEQDKAAGKAPAPVIGAAVGAGIGLTMGLMIKVISKSEHPAGARWWGTHVVLAPDPVMGRLRMGLRW